MILFQSDVFVQQSAQLFVTERNVNKTNVEGSVRINAVEKYPQHQEERSKKEMFFLIFFLTTTCLLISMQAWLNKETPWIVCHLPCPLNEHNTYTLNTVFIIKMPSFFHFLLVLCVHHVKR